MPIEPGALAQVRESIGIVTGPVFYDIEKGHIKRFAEAIGDPNPAYADEAIEGGVVAPPTFLRSCLPPPIPADIAGLTELRRVLEGGSEWRYFHPVRPGDRIAVTIELQELREREGTLGTMLITTSLLTYTDEHGRVVATQVLRRILY